MSISTKQIEDWKQQLTEGNTQRVLHELIDANELDADTENSLRILKTRYSTLEKTVRAGAISKQDEGVERNSVHLSIFEILDAVELSINTGNTKDKTSDEKKNKATTQKQIIWLLSGLLVMFLGYIAYQNLKTPINKPIAKPKTIPIHLDWPTNIPITENGKLEMSVGSLPKLSKTLHVSQKYQLGPVEPANIKDSIRFGLSDLPFEAQIAGQNIFFAQDFDSIRLRVEIPMRTYNGQVVNTQMKPLAMSELIFEQGLVKTKTDAQGNYSVQLPNMLRKNIQLQVKQNNKIVLDRRIGLDTLVLRQIKILE